MVLRKIIHSYPLLLLALAFPHESWSTDEGEYPIPLENVIEVQLGSESNQMLFFPGRILLRLGERYLIVLTNPSPVTHEFASETFAGFIETERVKFFDRRGDPVGYVFGSVVEVELLPGGRVEWIFTTTASSERIDLICDIPGHRDAGMVGEIQILR